jgi:23S rRNA pseudouridine1911/1915/1917 synthase
MKIENTSDTAKRVDVLLARANPSYSRAALAKLFGLGVITKDDGSKHEPGDKLQPGKYFFADISPINKPADTIDLPILYEDENVIVIDKPSGVISHARGKYWDEPSVASFIREKVAGLEGERAGIVHRLDRATSGVMICAKNSNSMSFLQKQFSTRKVKKQYIALITGVLDPLQATIDIPLARNPKNPKTFRPDPSGKNAITKYSTISQSKNHSLVKLLPETGRTHQLRVHMQYLKHPIIGDELYGGKQATRLFLHATSLEITLPGGKRVLFESKLPKEFSEYSA